AAEDVAQLVLAERAGARPGGGGRVAPVGARGSQPGELLPAVEHLAQVGGELGRRRHGVKAVGEQVVVPPPGGRRLGDVGAHKDSPSGGNSLRSRLWARVIIPATAPFERPMILPTLAVEQPSQKCNSRATRHSGGRRASASA